LIIQGPLWLSFAQHPDRRWPYMENGALTARFPPSVTRLCDWIRPAIRVVGREDWVFIKLHCHGMDPRDTPTLLGDSMSGFLRSLTEIARASRRFRLHFVSAREMVNIALAACDGLTGDPGGYRDYRLHAKL
jgi:hypothetical protein